MNTPHISILLFLHRLILNVGIFFPKYWYGEVTQSIRQCRMCYITAHPKLSIRYRWLTILNKNCDVTIIEQRIQRDKYFAATYWHRTPVGKMFYSWNNVDCVAMLLIPWWNNKSWTVQNIHENHENAEKWAKSLF